MRIQLRTSLRGKTLLIVLATLIGLVGGLGALSRLVILRGFSVLEANFARENLAQVFSSISNELETLDHTAAQHARRTRTYENLHQLNLHGIAEEFSDTDLAQLRVNFVAVTDE